MISQSERDLIVAIHDTPTKVCLVITGAGTSAISALFAVSGASRTVIDAQVPYSRSALDDYVGAAAEQHVSKIEAALMATRAYQRAVELSDSDGPLNHLVGLSCTAAIATDRVRRGENRAHIAWHDGERTSTISIALNKGARDRDGEESVCKALVLNALAEACGVKATITPKLLEGEHVERSDH